MKNLSYTEKELQYCIDSYIFSLHGLFTVGRIVTVLSEKHKGVNGVVQNITHDKKYPLKKDMVRVWLDGFSCLDIFDFEEKELYLNPYKY